MYSTLKNFKIMLDGFDFEGENLTDLVSFYRNTMDPRAICYVYVNQFGHLKNITDKFPKLTPEDKVSFILEEIEKALLTYDETKGAQLQTLVSTYVYRRCYAENEMRKNKIRRLDYDTELNSSYEVFVEQGVEKSEFDYYECEFADLLEKLELTEKERLYCMIIGQESHVLKDSEVARIMNITPAAVNYIKKRLAIKLKPAIA